MAMVSSSSKGFESSSHRDCPKHERYVKMQRARTTRKKMTELEMSNYTLDGISCPGPPVSFFSIPIDALFGISFRAPTNMMI
ncbi:hypothetical protein ZWY2020_054738 [Hordeum vulgare]|nr:hypothetical protein ZWY2020_054738 [Hordeum vulgare]